MAQSNRKFYRDNGAAAYDVYAWNDQAARQYEDGRAYERSRQYELPEEQVREQPYRRVKSRTAIAPFTLVGMLTVACLMILVIFGYVQLFEASSSVSKLENQLANLKEQQLMLQSKYDAKIDLTAAEEYAAEIGLTKCQPEQIVYVSFSGTGDLFASVICGSRLNGFSTEEAAERAGKFLYDSIADTMNDDTAPNDGVNFEKFLRELM